jgi:hypothetical protein
MNLDEISEMRRRCDEIRTALSARYPIATPADWFDRTASNATWHVAFTYACLPTIGEEISACLSIFPNLPSASVAWEHRWGLIANPDVEIDDHDVQFASGDIAVDANQVAKLDSAAKTFWNVGGAVLPQMCYDGTPVSLTVTAHPFVEFKTGSCNIGDTGSHSTRQLARLVVGLVGCGPGRTT